MAKKTESKNGKVEVKRISELEFTLKMIEKMRNPKKSKGIHTVYTKLDGINFNQYFEAYFGYPSKDVTNKLAKEGKIGLVPVKGGVMIYKPADIPKVDRYAKVNVDLKKLNSILS